MMAALVITVTLFLSVGAHRVTLRGGRSNDWIADLNVSPTLAEVTRLRRFACNIRFLYYAIYTSVENGGYKQSFFNVDSSVTHYSVFHIILTKTPL